MSNTFIRPARPYSVDEIGAATNAFLQYEEEQQVHLLTVMPEDEAVGILSNCSVSYVQYLLGQMSKNGFEQRAKQFTKLLGFVLSDELSSRPLASGSFSWQQLGLSVLCSLLLSALFVTQYETVAGLFF
ncbi:hypothetical protein [Vibrio sp. SCSIO 43137]|uniref:hypothetical protein n=1 Tax=Vibrio sp. SCSIO 43137 TaxID=3021011 RepID=UPI0023081CC1|nr:hypothetical protein [Vibrio sp. SCSIO 43137]WCE29177.1 hypothetical protein PK654_12660 [Vibrio sp. SCSIO 43137]